MAEPIFDAPIPGSSLTKEMGNQPWKNPPQHTTLEEALDFYVDRMATDEFTNKLVTSLEMGVPVSSIANIIQIHGVMEGRHTLDVSIMLTPIIMEMIALIADTMGIEYDMGLENEDSIEEANSDIINVARLKLRRKQIEENEKELGELEEEEVSMPEDIQLEENMPMISETEQVEDEMPRGLMARGV